MNAELQASTYSSAVAANTLVDAVVANKRKILVTGFTCFNPGAAIAYVQLFDELAVNVILGTTVPKFILPLPAGGGIDGPNGSQVFGKAVCYAVTATATGAGAAAGPCIVQFYYA